MENLLNILFPPTCMFCSAVGKVFCLECLQKCTLIYSTECIICGEPTLFGQTHYHCSSLYTPKSTFSLFEYEHYTRECIRRAKYSTKEFMALKELTIYGITQAQQLGYKLSPKTLLIPIPLNKFRQKDRGFNQAEIIAKQFSRRFGVRMTTKVLRRTKNTKRQVSKTRFERFANVADAFEVYPKIYIAGKTLVLVDDVLTTGATLLEATKTLYKAGAGEVHCVTLSKRPLKG